MMDFPWKGSKAMTGRKIGEMVIMCSGNKVGKSQFMLDEKEAYDDLEYHVQRLDLECSDNARVYKEGDDEGKLWYEMRRETGCCGCFESHTMVNGHKWFIGCNYGH